MICSIVGNYDYLVNFGWTSSRGHYYTVDSFGFIPPDLISCFFPFIYFVNPYDFIDLGFDDNVAFNTFISDSFYDFYWHDYELWCNFSIGKNSECYYFDFCDGEIGSSDSDFFNRYYKVKDCIRSDPSLYECFDGNYEGCDEDYIVYNQEFVFKAFLPMGRSYNSSVSCRVTDVDVSGVPDCCWVLSYKIYDDGDWGHDILDFRVCGLLYVKNGSLYLGRAGSLSSDNPDLKLASVGDDVIGYYFYGRNGGSYNINQFDHHLILDFTLFDGGGDFMACTDECIIELSASIDRLGSLLSNSIDLFNHSFSEAFNKIPINSQINYGSGSVFKSNDLDNYDFYDSFQNFHKSFSEAFNLTVIDSVNLFGLSSVFKQRSLNTDDPTFFDVLYSAFVPEANDDSFGLGSVFMSNDNINPDERTFFDMLKDSFNYFGLNNCRISISELFKNALNIGDCGEGSVFKANDNIWNDEDTLAGILYKQFDYDYLNSDLSRISAFYTNVPVTSSSGPRLPSSLPYLFRLFGFKDTFLGDKGSNSVLKHDGLISLTNLFNRAFFADNNNNSSPNKSTSVFTYGLGTDNYKILNHSCSVNPNSIKFCESVSQPAIPVEISAPVEISQPEDEWGEPVPFKMDWKPLLDLLSEALFCQFGNDGLDPRASWGYSVFNKLLYPLHAEGCDDKVGLPELDFSEGFLPDNIFVNSNGLIARFNSEIYK